MGYQFGGDIEAGKGELYPAMMESPEMRWAFIRKVYVILSLQLILTISVASAVVFVPPIKDLVLHAGVALYILALVLCLIIMIVMLICHKKHPLNLILLVLFTITMAFAVGIVCSLAPGKIIFEAAILTGTVTISLTLYTFWAAKRGHDFNFLGPFLFGALLVLTVFGLIQLLFPMGKLSMMVYCCLGAIIFCGYIVFDTDNLIKRYSYDEYVCAAIALYLDIVNLFILLLSLLGLEG